VLALVLGFRSSDALANAYGIAVAGDMLVTTVMVTIVALGAWQWSRPLVLAAAALFFVLDLAFVSANVHKIPSGGWFPLVVGAIALTLMLTWRRGRSVALAHREKDALSLEEFTASWIDEHAPQRVPGVAVYLTGRQDTVPAALLLNLKHNRVLHELVIVLNVETKRTPRVNEQKRVVVEDLSRSVRKLTVKFGFAEKPDVLLALDQHSAEVGFNAREASFFLGREVPVPSLRPEVPLWQERLYAFMTRNAVRAPDYFLIPAPQVIELGTKVEL
jgi:KUP system potassium uptake protein